MIDDRILEELEGFRDGLEYDKPPDWIGRAPGQPLVLGGRALLSDADLHSIVEASGGKLIRHREPPYHDDSTSAKALEVVDSGATSTRRSWARETIVLNDPEVTDSPHTLANWIRHELKFERLRVSPCMDPIAFKIHMDEQCRRLIYNIEAWLRWKNHTRWPSWISNPPHDPADRLEFWLNWLETPDLKAVVLRPNWNCESGELTLGGKVAKHIRNMSQATNAIAVLEAFQGQGWPYRIVDPLPGGRDRYRLRETLNSLNRGIKGMCFRGGGDGKSVIWEIKG